MRFPRLVLFLSSIGTVSAVLLMLSGCTSSMTSSGTGAAPTVTAVALQEDLEPTNKQEVQFSEAMDPSTINAQTFTVRDPSGHAVGGVVTYDAGYKIASFQPSPALQPVSKYTATIATGVASAGGAHLTVPYTYTFTTTYNSTGDYNQPFSINSVSPAADATCVSATAVITITFDRPPDASTVNSTNIVVTGPGGAVIPVTMSINVATTQVVLTPTSSLPSGNITVTVNKVGDLADVLMTAPYTWSFSTACGGGGGGGSNSFVYAGDMTNIAGFEIAADGSATAVPGSPFTLAANALVASPSGNILFGDGQTGPGAGMDYYTYSVAANGAVSTASSTTQIPTNPVNGTQAEGLNWITTDRTGATLYGEELNGSSNSGYQWISEYAIRSSGSLSSLGTVDAQDDDSEITFTPDNRHGYFVVVPPMSNPSAIAFLTRNSDGTLTANGALNVALPEGAPPASMPAYAVVSPNSNYLAVVYQQNSLAGVGDSSGLAIYPINSDGTVGPPTPFLALATGAGFGVWSLAWDSDGTYVFVSTAGNIYEARFDSSADTVALGGTTTSTTGQTVLADRMSFLNGHLFAVNPAAQSLYVYNFSNGVLTPAPDSPVALGFRPTSIVALQR